ncbi:hypothetical protein TNCV_816151 [Trichonephila clavipes]|nr:hypothetical protein TNCV_816151 [Trichonephila clavipes]
MTQQKVLRAESSSNGRVKDWHAHLLAKSKEEDEAMASGSSLRKKQGKLTNVDNRNRRTLNKKTRNDRRIEWREIAGGY